MDRLLLSWGHLKLVISSFHHCFELLHEVSCHCCIHGLGCTDETSPRLLHEFPEIVDCSVLSVQPHTVMQRCGVPPGARASAKRSDA